MATNTTLGEGYKRKLPEGLHMEHPSKYSSWESRMFPRMYLKCIWMRLAHVILQKPTVCSNTIVTILATRLHSFWLEHPFRITFFSYLMKL
ncbi:hypothetical protein LINPERPRIM_LOCUS25098 [Linum perenne]